MSEIDDFANDKEMQKIRSAREAFEQMLNGCIADLKTRLMLEDGTEEDVKSFENIKSLNAASVNYIYASKREQKPFLVSIIDYYSYSNTPRSYSAGSRNLYLVGLLKLKQKYPNTIIYREGIAEKITDLVTKAEIDFENSKKFSRRYYVLTEDKDALEKICWNKELDNLAEFSNMEIEIRENVCMFRSSRKPVSPEETDLFCELAATLNQTLNKY